MNDNAREYVITLGFGGLLINTLPLWIGELATHPAVSDQLAGVFGSLTLLLAAGACGWLRWRALVDRSWLILSLSLVGFALTSGVSAILSMLACCCMGLSMGAALSKALRLHELARSPKLIARGMTIGLVGALVAYLFVAVTQISIIWILVALAIAVLFLGRRSSAQAGDVSLSVPNNLAGVPLWFLPFFVMMGAYWAFLDVFAARIPGPFKIELWLLGSLISGALGSVLAGGIRDTLYATTLAASLLLAAISGAATYLSGSPFLIGLSILANGFFLFLFFPLYLQAAPEHSTRRMAIYLAGFAFGGVIGAAILQFGGYVGLGMAIAISGLLGVKGTLQPRQGL